MQMGVNYWVRFFFKEKILINICKSYISVCNKPLPFFKDEQSL